LRVDKKMDLPVFVPVHDVDVNETVRGQNTAGELFLDLLQGDLPFRFGAFGEVSDVCRIEAIGYKARGNQQAFTQPLVGSMNRKGHHGHGQSNIENNAETINYPERSQVGSAISGFGSFGIRIFHTRDSLWWSGMFGSLRGKSVGKRKAIIRKAIFL
jgi:hypothetical protein